MSLGSLSNQQFAKWRTLKAAACSSKLAKLRVAKSIANTNNSKNIRQTSKASCPVGPGEDFWGEKLN